MMRSNSVIADELYDLEEGRIDPKQFPHREHVRLRFSKCSAVMLFRKRSRVLQKDCDSSPSKAADRKHITRRSRPRFLL